MSSTQFCSIMVDSSVLLLAACCTAIPHTSRLKASTIGCVDGLQASAYATQM